MKVVVSGSFTASLINFRGPLITAMLERGHEVVAIGPEKDEPTLARLRSMGVRFVQVPLQRTGVNPVRDLRYLVAMTRFFACERPDAVLTYTIKPIVFGMLAARLAGVPIRAAMVEGLGYPFGASTFRQRVVGFVASNLYRLSLRLATVVFFLNPDDMAEFQSRRLVPPERSRLIAGTGIDLARYAPSEPPSGPPAYLTIARLMKEKGVKDFVAAARIVRSRHPEAVFRLLGPFDPHPDAISKREVDAWHEDGVIEYLGVTDDVRPFLAACSVYVLPSYREGLPRTTLEALSTGRAVITTDVPGCRETVEHGVNGFLVPVRDPPALAAAMETFIENPALIRSMGAASLDIARRRFEVRIVNRDVLEGMGL